MASVNFSHCFKQNLQFASSRTMDKLIEELFSETLPDVIEVSSSAMKTLRNQMQQELSASQQAAEEERKWHLTLSQEKLVQMKQVCELNDLQPWMQLWSWISACTAFSNHF